MKALSVRQPWAFLIAKGFKDVENRTWRTDFRGRVYIHASKKFDGEGYARLLHKDHIPPKLRLLLVAADGIFHGPYFKRAYGAIVGEVDIVDCVTESDSPWFEGPYGLVLANPLQYGTPIPCKGQLGFFDVNTKHETQYSTTFRDK